MKREKANVRRVKIFCITVLRFTFDVSLLIILNLLLKKILILKKLHSTQNNKHVYIYSGAEIPKILNPFANTICVAFVNVKRDLLNDLSSDTTRWKW